MIKIKKVGKIQITAILLVYLLLLIFWAFINYSEIYDSVNYKHLFGLLYTSIALMGAINGLVSIQKKWGGWRSAIGRGVIFLSLGLLGQFFGQLIWSYYVVVKNIDIPYPSLADVAYFSIIPFYSIAVFNFAKATGAKMKLRTVLGKIETILIPAALVILTYLILLKGNDFNLNEPIKLFLDFGYPGLETIAISFAILAYRLSRGILGGVIKNKIILVVGALIFQYITDFLFLYLVEIDLYSNAGFIDLMYTTSTTLMAIAITYFGVIDPKQFKA